MAGLRRFWAIGLLALVMAVQVSGCSLIGLGAGASADAANRRAFNGPPVALVKVSGGRPVALVLMNGDTLHGRFKRAVVVKRDEYARRHAAWLNQEPLAAGSPSPGDRVTVIGPGHTEQRTTFRAYAPGGLRVGREAEPRWIPWSDVDAIGRGDGASISAEVLMAAEREGRLPTDTNIEIAQGSEVRSVPANEILKVRAGRRGTHYWFVGLLVGAGIDYMIITEIRDAPSSPDCDYYGPLWGL